MFLKRFSRPKWQHPDPEVRRQALSALDPDDPALSQIAAYDEDSAIRSAAICACRQLDAVARIWRTDSDQGVRNTALRRIGLLLAGTVDTQEERDNRLALLAELQDPEVIQQVARQARDRTIRGAALERVTDALALGRLIAEETDPELRARALERIDSVEVLHDLARRWRGHDKRLHRLAQSLAEQAEEKAARPARIEEICASMQDLAEGRATLAHDAIKALDDRWQGLAEFAAPDRRSAYEAARDRARSELEDRQQARQRKQQLESICVRLDSMLRELRQRHELDAEQAAALDQDFHAIKHEWQGADGDRDEADELRQRYAAVLHKVIEQRERLLQSHQRRDAHEQHLEKGRQLLDDRRLDKRAAERWQRDCERLSLPADKLLADDLKARVRDLGERLLQRAEILRQEREQAADGVFAELAELSQLLDQGQLQPAIRLSDRIRGELDRLGRLPTDKQRRVDRQLNAARQRIRELRGWRRWGSNHVREELIEQAEALCESDLPPAPLAEKIRHLRDEWQKLDKSDTSTNEALWEKFNQLCTRAYEPCKAHFEQLGRERDALVDARRAQCDELQSWYEQIDWEEPDWRGIDRRLGQARRAWREAAAIRGKERRLLEERFHALLETFEKHLKPERDRNQAERRELIDEAAALLESEDMRSAIQQAKQLQQQWNVTVSARRRRDDQKLWQAFRGNLDQVFARRDAQAQTQRQHRDAAAEALAELTDGLNATLESAADEPALRQALRDAGKRRREIDGLPRNRERQLEQRYERVVADVNARLEQLQRQGELERLDALAAHGACCARLEESALAGAGDWDQRLAEFEQACAALPPIDAAAEQRLRTRLAAAESLDPRDQATRDLLDAARQRMAENLLHLEILAGVDSPAQYQRERLALQVSRLSVAMTDSESNRDSHGRQLMEQLADWYLDGPLEAPDRAELTERVNRVRASLAS